MNYVHRRFRGLEAAEDSSFLETEADVKDPDPCQELIRDAQLLLSRNLIGPEVKGSSSSCAGVVSSWNDGNVSDLYAIVQFTHPIRYRYIAGLA